jgi:TonB-dependent SusC/RagA subfamily outer membrane receptor
MMNKEKTQPVYKIKWLLLPLVVAAILMSFNMKRALATNVDFAVNSEIIEPEPIAVDDTVVSAVPTVATGNTVAVSAITRSDSSDYLIVIIDGKESNIAELSKLNTVKSISVLKGDAAIKTYGKGKNGVIVVKTKDDKNSSEQEKEIVVSVGSKEILKYTATQLHGRVKSITSTDTTSKALIIIDDKESNATVLSKLDVDSIHSFSILKDPTATQLYGDKGKNGVIVVETKSKATAEFDKQAAEFVLQFFADFDKQAADFDKQAADFDKQAADFDKQAADFDKQAAEFDKQVAEFDKQAAEFDKQAAELDKQAAELDKQAAEFDTTLGVGSHIIINGKKSNLIILSKLKPDDIESTGHASYNGKTNVFTIGTKDNVIIPESDETSDIKYLFIIDNKEANKDDLLKLETNAIKSLSVIKSEAAVAMYGAKGKNGVIIVKTK